MYIKIQFVDSQQPIAEIEPDEQKGDELIELLGNLADGGWMALESFIGHLRAGRFGNDVTVRFNIVAKRSMNATAAVERTPIIRYEIESQNAPAALFVESLVDNT